MPGSVIELAKGKRAELIEQLAGVGEEIWDLIICDDTPHQRAIAEAIRRVTAGLSFSWVPQSRIRRSSHYSTEYVHTLPTPLNLLSLHTIPPNQLRLPSASRQLLKHRFLRWPSS